MASENWCECQPMSGTGSASINVAIDRNLGRNSRKATVQLIPQNLSEEDLSVILSQPIESRQIQITQAGSAEFLTADVNVIRPTKLAQVVEFTGKTNLQKIEPVIDSDWAVLESVQYSLNGSTWYDCTGVEVPDDPGKTTDFYFRVGINITENQTVTTRTASITFGEQPLATVSIVQQATDATLSLSDAEHEFNGTLEDSFELSVYSNTNWKTEKSSYQFSNGDKVVVQLSGTSGTGKAKITCKPSTSMENRELTIKFMTNDGSKSMNFLVKQTPGVFPDFNEDYNNDFLAL